MSCTRLDGAWRELREYAAACSLDICMNGALVVVGREFEDSPLGMFVNDAEARAFLRGYIAALRYTGGTR